MTPRIDYPHELGNGWDRYQVMVLTELKRLADNDDKKTDTLIELGKNLAVFSGAVHTLSENLSAHTLQAAETERHLDERLRAVESNTDETRGVAKYKTAAFPVIVSAITTLLVGIVGWWVALKAGVQPPG